MGCGVTFSLRYGGANDVVKHFSTKNHWQAVKAKASLSTLARFGVGSSEEALKAKKIEHMQVLHAEALFVQFVAEHNL